MTAYTRTIQGLRCDHWVIDQRCDERFEASAAYTYGDFIADAEQCGWRVGDDHNDWDICPTHSGGAR